MVSTGAKLVARARQREAATTARSFANAFDQKQSSFARRAEEERIKAEAESNMFEVSQHRSAPRASNPGFRGASGRGAKFQLSEASASIPTESLGTNIPAPAEAEPVDDSRTAKRHRFEEVIANSRRTRADFQKEREERHKETDELDAQFEGLLPLLPKRDKRQEDVDRFRGITRPEVQSLLDAKDAAKPVKGGRRFVLSDDGSLTRLDAATEPNAADTQRMEAIRASILEPKSADSREAAVPQVAVVDEFDAMLGSFKMEMKRAQPVDRVLLPEEEAVRDIAQQLMEMDRERRPELKMDYDRTRTEWVDAGGDSAYQMEDADEGTHNPLLGDGRQRLAVDDILAQIEEMCARTELDASAEHRAKTLAGFASALWHAANKQKRHAEDSFKLLLIDAQRRSYKGLKLSRFHHTVFYLATKLFPCTDFRHPVTTPLSILLSHLCMNTKLMDVASCAHALWYASLLLNCLQSAKRFASECVIVALNVISMQLPRPSSSDSLQFPVLERSPQPILQSHACEAKTVEPIPFLLLDGDQFDSTFSKRRGGALVVDVLAAAYHLLLNAAETFGDSPSFEAIFHCFVESLHKKLTELEPPHPLIRDLHTRAIEQIATLIASNAMERTPLAMRTFRPRPLRQFEPLMVDDTPTVKKELQLLRQEVREDHRRVMRTLQAEARVEQRDRDAVQARTDERKKAKYDTIMAELQQQQHIMKDADALRTKAAGKKRAAKDVVPKTQNSD